MATLLDGTEDPAIILFGKKPTSNTVKRKSMLGVDMRSERFPYKPKEGFYSGYSVNADGTVSAKLGNESVLLNGINVDLKKLGAIDGAGGSIGKMKLDNKGNLVAQMTYDVANPNYGRPSGLGIYPDQKKTVSKTDWVQLSGFQADMDNASRSRSGDLPSENNVYLRADEGGLLAEVEAIWRGKSTFTAAYARQLQNPEKNPAGERLSTRGSGTTSTLGGAPTSSAAGGKAADDINLRNRKGTLLT